MQVTSEQAAFITDYEVFQLLKDKERNAEGKKKARLKPVEQMTLQYLNTTPAAKHTRASVTECLSLLEKYPITEVEKLQVLNLQPTSEVEVHMMIEECAERLESDSVSELVEQMRSLQARNRETEAHRPPPPAPPPSGLSHVSLAVKGGAPADMLSASGGDTQQRTPVPSPPKERVRPEHPRKEDPNTPSMSKSRQMEELIKTASNAPRSTRSGNVLK